MLKLFGDKLHIISLCMWVFIMSLNAIDEHSGYEFPWSVFNLTEFNVSAEFHDFHHSHNHGTYGAILNIYDRAFGSDVEFKKHLLKEGL